MKIKILSLLAALIAFAVPSQAQVHYAASVAVNVAPGATDIVSISGNPGVSVKVTKVSVAGYAPDTMPAETVLVRRSTQDTGGCALVWPVAKVPTAPQASALVRAYASNPTLGVLVGAAARANVVFNNQQTNIPVVFNYDEPESWTLNTADDTMVVNLCQTTVPKGVAFVNIEWTETPKDTVTGTGRLVFTNALVSK